MNTITRFLNDESGATAIEYGLIAALVAVAAIAGFQLLGQNLGTTLGKVNSALNPS